MTTMDNLTGGSQQFCLRWNNHQHNLLTVFDNLLQNESFVDVTIAVEGVALKAHKMVLSACSPYFESLFVNSPDKHPIVFLKDVKFVEMRALLDFMYKGEVSVDQENLASLLKVAESLRIKGLTEVSEQKSAEAAKYHSTIGEPPAKKMVTSLPTILPLSSTTLANVAVHNLSSLKRKRGRPRTLSPTLKSHMADSAASPKENAAPPVNQAIHVNTTDVDEVTVNHKPNGDDRTGLLFVGSPNVIPSKQPSPTSTATPSSTSPDHTMIEDKPVDLKIECKDEPQRDHDSPTGSSEEQVPGTSGNDATEKSAGVSVKSELDDSRGSETSGTEQSKVIEEAADGNAFIDVEGGYYDYSDGVRGGKRGKGLSGMDIEGPPYICKECGKEFPAVKALTRHRDRNHSLITHPCKECGAIFKRTDHLSRHVRSVHGLVCQLCQNVFIGKENYNQHMVDAHHMNLEVSALDAFTIPT